MITRRLTCLFTLFFGLFLISFGLISFSKRFGWIDYSFAGYSSPEVIMAGVPSPVQITINTVGISLAIEKRVLESRRWPVSDSGGEVGQTGNAIIYAHNWPALFGDLKKIRVGDEVGVELSNGQTVTFMAQSITVVTSDQTHILDETSDRRLTLYTCTGFLDRKRLVVVAIART